MDFSEGDSEEFSLALNSLIIGLNEQGVYFLPGEVEESIKCCIQHHQRHLKALRVNQISVDPYKIITWFAFDLAHRGDGTRKREILKAAVAALNVCVSNEKPKGLGLGADTLRYILDLAHNESEGVSDHGIGKNGLFSSFHCAKKMKNLMG